MNKKELMQQIKDAGYKVIDENERETGREGGIVHKAVPGIKFANSVGIRKWFKFYQKEPDMSCYWMDADPFAQGETKVSFNDELNTYLQHKISDGIIKAGFIEQINQQQETATVQAVMSGTDKLMESRFLVNKDSEGNLQHQKIG